MLGTETSLKGLASATRTGPASYSTTSKAGKNTVHRTDAGVRAEYKRQHCLAMGIGIGPRLHSECPFGVTADQFNPDNSAALERVIRQQMQLGARDGWGGQLGRELRRELRRERRWGWSWSWSWAWGWSWSWA